ncbi:MAG TPA: hypothetical protein P5320_09570 [Bacteroidales bacterium]|nr:hypothetical protein [Bacteroidales bacterium]HOK75143.1 hypothetical protein [Bacteroidales bacterium]HOM39955.1 hypothetical protein [Bacteroidales bacterium]HOU30431.1 hypothetical protein [Bacteroidales bacterium]HPP92297.1 hypothetical protein [Bacteroidales bacterium]
MKRLVFILLLATVIVVATSSCTKKTCPAYSKAVTENTELRRG